MVQLRLTSKYATDCKIKHLSEPVEVIKALDDWVIDVIRIKRRKVAMVSHVQSMLTFFIPYYQVGGAASIPECIFVLLTEYLYANNLEFYLKDLQTLFANDNFSFCKTNNKKIIGHMTDLKFHIEYIASVEDFEAIDWDACNERINNIIINFYGNDYLRPNDIMLNLLQKELHL